jgi:3-oxoacyl-[acyl-carrier protein] reductase
MDLKIKDQWFLVGGATSGLGKAVAERLLREEANVFAIARREEELKTLEKKHPGRIKYLAADLSQPETINKIKDIQEISKFSGILVNAGGPPAMTFLETKIEDWDEAYRLLVRWKVQITKLFLPEFVKKGYGKFVFIESAAVKQAIENLVLSNSLRMAVVGMVKTISQEVAETGVTLNIMGPGYHDTAAVQRLFKKKSELTGMSFHEAKDTIINNIPVGEMGNPDDFATLAVWLLSPYAKYITGQTFSIDGGTILSSLG